ncbi:CBS domain-containing protein [Shumkonia mesophila]|uniref:CBS domain-containing protein n=1 Tax=Shumkonia mesophila TaxID=2838854 RepID=UPI0029347B75|nr:CBS domain-containing protein [Shumkonia mesophila]
MRRIIPDVVKDQSIHTLPLDGTALEAARMMANRDIGAILILEKNGLLAGILTERDITRRIVANGLDPKKTTVADIMTRNPDTLSPDDSEMEALEIMRVRRYRHLPVTVDGKAVAMVSVRDLYEVMKDELEESIRETEAFVFGDRYGA